MVILLAVLFALQSVIIMPTTSGTADRTAQAQIQEETRDALGIAAREGALSETIRNWDSASDAWIDDERDDAEDEPAFYRADQPGPDESLTYETAAFANQSSLGAILESRFAAQGWNYNVELVAADGTDDGAFETTPLVYQGSAPPDAVTASYVVTLYEDEELTSPDGDEIALEDAHRDHAYPIASAGDDSPVYAVVEVRATVW
jgi:hypothetical protein